MLYSEDMTGHAIIGEAAVNLAVRDQDITVDALISELAAMLKADSSHSRDQAIRGAINWLRGHRSISAKSTGEDSWILPDAGHSGTTSQESTIRLMTDDDNLR
ncbi:hypothetical protein [Pantoea sp. SM3]|uniref:hypothetical protein n=1 Tax=Pantoea sp. SM3 TaxID=1628192 RepID=UPI0005F788D6|nr:hypothetical protein [Pantoea sp. SM3]KJV33725.1 hypothetical protein VI01_06380 [Pantoea sp. SM3]